MRVSVPRGQHVSVHLGVGNLNATNVDGDLVLDAAAAGVSASGGRGNLIADTGSGDVRISLAQDIDQLDVDTGSGSVTIHAPPTLGASLRVETGSGDIDSDFPLTITHREPDSLLASIGDGRGRIVIDSGSGSVHLLRGGDSAN